MRKVFEVGYSYKTFDGIIGAGVFDVTGASSIQEVQATLFPVVLNRIKDGHDEDSDFTWCHDFQNISCSVTEKDQPVTVEDLEEIKSLWGEDLFEVFGAYIDQEGWLTADWATILEAEVPKFDEHFRDNPEYSGTYQKMYLTEFEVTDDEKYIRPLVDNIP